MEKDSIIAPNGANPVDSNRSLRLWLHLIRDRRWSRRQKHQLLKIFKAPKYIYQASSFELENAISGKVRQIQPSFFARPLADEALVERDLAWLESNDARCVVFGSPDYPKSLSQISDPPLALFILGDVSLFNEPQIAIVGSRRPTPVGAKLTRQFAQELSDVGVVITSGMALGVDGLSHQGALDQGGSTIAVMGCGLDTVYPARNKCLFNKIKESGLLVSEYPIGVKPSKYTFPERNRIVSGLSLGVLIVEAAQKSGTMITARLAIEQNKELMVVPGSALSQQYEGSHSLIADGATLVTSRDDVLFALKKPLSDFSVDAQGNRHFLLNTDARAAKNSEKAKAFIDDKSITNQSIAGDSDALQLLNLMGAESVSVETLIMGSGLTPAQVSAMLLILELEDKVAMSDDGGYININ